MIYCLILSMFLNFFFLFLLANTQEDYKNLKKEIKEEVEKLREKNLVLEVNRVCPDGYNQCLEDVLKLL